MERSSGWQLFWLRIWLYVLPSLFVLLASSIYFIAPQVDRIAPFFAVGMAAICMPLQLFLGYRLEKRFGLGALPGRAGLVFYLGFLILMIGIGYVVHWQAKNLLGFPLILLFASSCPSYVASFKVGKACGTDTRKEA